MLQECEDANNLGQKRVLDPWGNAFHLRLQSINRQNWVNSTWEIIILIKRPEIQFIVHYLSLLLISSLIDLFILRFIYSFIHLMNIQRVPTMYQAH